ncbi:neutral protease 2 [Moniliophthora roreri]|nr:neutral protease 2 [Moniliophthora roreri]
MNKVLHGMLTGGLPHYPRCMLLHLRPRPVLRRSFR